jgi:hypothetical protein
VTLLVEALPPSQICTGYFQISSGTTAFTVTAPAGSRWARVQVEVQNIRYRMDGVVPTATTGMLLSTTASTQYLFGMSDWTKFNAIPATSGGVFNIEFFADRAVNT